MYHLRRIKVLLTTCMLSCASLWAQDTKLSLDGASAWASSDQGGNEGAASVIDGDYGKFWHSQWSWGPVFNPETYGHQPSVDLTIALSEVTLVDYVRYIPRQNNNQGHWGEVEVFYSASTSGEDFTSVGTFDLKKADIPYDFFLNGLNGVLCGQIKFTIRSGSNNHATAAEIEMYQLNKDKLNAFADYFDDEVYSQLKPGVTSSKDIADADVKALVDRLLSDAEAYKKFRVGEYEAYETLATLQQRLKTKDPYSKYENPTGVYFGSDQMYLVAVSGIEDDAVGLKVKNWYTNESTSTYSLRNGLNYITATTEGNVFVNYYTDNYDKAPNVRVHFINAPVIGYWDAETMDNADWEKLLADKSTDDDRIIITQSEHAQLAFPISAWKEHCPTDVETVMEHYQNVQWALRDMMGLEMYGYQTKNRQLYYATNYGFMAAGEEGAYCDYESLGAIMKPDNKSFDFWGVGHEWGHNNQIYPGFHWSGCGETTNNIYASWAQYHFTGNRDANGHPTYLRLEDEKTGIDEYSDMRGGRMQTYFEEALRKGVAWQLQDGPDYHGAAFDTNEVDEYDADGNLTGNKVRKNSRNYDHFVKLAPFWQLNLWGTLANKCPYIIPKVIHAIRTADNYGTTYNTNGKQQINWMKLACDAAEIDLLPFFEKAGMLRPIHAYIEDYDAGWNIITEEMINELKQYVRGAGYPAFTEEINYINAHNMHIYRDKLKLNVAKLQGELNGDKLTIQHSVAQNAVAFETYNAQGNLIRITMYGLGSDDEHSFTQVLFPSDAAYVKAVGYNGERQLVYTVLDNQELQAKKEELLTLINSTNSLINTCGKVTYTSGKTNEALVLQTTNPSADNYLSTNAAEPEEGNVNNLLTDDQTTYFHSAWSLDVNAVHHLKVDLGNGKSLKEFTFTYRTHKRPYPYEIKVYGSNDDDAYTLLKTFSKSELPTTTADSDAYKELWTSPTISSDVAYRYLRFDVTNSGGTYSNANPKGEYCFSMSYFGITVAKVSESYTVELGDKVGDVDEELLLTTYKAVQSALAACDHASTEAQLQSAISDLAEAKEALYSAMYPNVEFTVNVNIAGGGVTFEGGEPCVGGGTLIVSASLTLDELKAKLKVIELTGYVAQPITINEGVITVIYNKVYTIHITGGEGNGRITFNGTEYAHEGTFNALQESFTDGDLTANDIEGYNKSEVNVNHETGIVSVTYTLDRSELNNLIVDTEELMQACQAFVNSAYVTELLLSNTSTAITAARETCGMENLTYAGYADAVSALQTAYETLNTAKGEAEREAAERNTIRTALNTLMDNTNVLITLCGTAPGDATEALIKEVSDAVASAQEVANDMGSTVDALTTATETLQAKYNVLNAAQQSTAKAELRDLIAQAEALIAECGTYGYGEHEVKTPIALQTDDEEGYYWLSTNADQNVVGDGKDGGGIAALIDGTVETYMHTQWSGTAVADDHYIQVDLGNGKDLAEFTFTYATRKGSSATYTSPAPTTIELYGSTDGTTFTDKIATFTASDEDNPLISYEKLGEYWASSNIKPNKKYDYLRFYVKKSNGPAGIQYGGHYFFAMSEFALMSVTREISYYIESLNPYGSVTEEQLLEVLIAKTEAETLTNTSYDKAELESKKNALKDLYEALLLANNTSSLPVALTVDVKNPVLYTIKSKRGEGKVLQYDPADNHMFCIADAAEDKTKQAFYFTLGDDRTQVYVHPFAAGEQVLAAENTDNGAAKVFAADKNTAASVQWKFVERGEGCYNLQPVGTSTYFSNFNGGTAKMGFYDASPDSDPGSLFQFASVEVDGSSAYHSLNIYYDEVAKVRSSSIVGGSGVGYYPVNEANAYNSAYSNATTYLEGEATYEQYLDAYKNLKTANESLELNMPSADKLYRFVSVVKGDGTNAYVYANPEDNKMYWATGKDDADATAIWKITPSTATEGLYNITNLHTDSCINEFINYKPTPLNEVAGNINIVSLSLDGQVGFKCNGTMMHAQSDGAVVHWETGANDGSAWRIVEVEETPIHTLTVGSVGWSTLMLGYDTTIPAGVEIYTISEIENDWATLTTVEGVLPAGEAVLVKASAGSYDFVYTTDEATIESNELRGTTTTKKVSSVTDGVVYTLQSDNGQIVFMQYADEENPEADLDLAANKAYLVLPANTNAISIRFGEGDDTTSIAPSTLNSQTEFAGRREKQPSTEVFDLMGRRVPRVIKGGIYIVNGKKTVF